MTRILVSGSLVYDRIMDFPGKFKDHILPDNIHILNVSFVVGRLAVSRGGTAGNIAYTIKLLGGEPTIVGALGKDGGDYFSHFDRMKIDTRYIGRDIKHLTSSCHIMTDKDDNQITGFFSGIPPERTPKMSSVKEKSSFAIVSPTHKEVMKRHVRECAKLSVTTIFDPGQQITTFTPVELREMVNAADIVIGNDYEIKVLGERTGWDNKEIMRRSGMLIITLGGKGSVILQNGKGEIKIPPCRGVKAVDPTGAGDAYRSGFLVGLSEGRSLEVAGRMGSVAASYAIESPGTQEHSFTRSAFWARYKKNYGRGDI